MFLERPRNELEADLKEVLTKDMNRGFFRILQMTLLLLRECIMKMYSWRQNIFCKFRKPLLECQGLVEQRPREYIYVLLGEGGKCGRVRIEYFRVKNLKRCYSWVLMFKWWSCKFLCPIAFIDAFAFITLWKMHRLLI